MKTIILLITCLLAFPGNLKASDLITYQGKLTNGAGADLPNGDYRIGVRIWDVATGGETPLWARKYDVPVNAGVFSLMIGAEGLPWGTVGEAGGPLTASLKLALSGTSRFVEITVMSEAGQAEKPAGHWQVLAPRQALGSVPYAMNGVPTGTVVPFAGATAPEGWLMCDGTTTLPINDPNYSNLHNTIGNAFNIGGEPIGHFRVPDMRGRTAIGTGAGSTRAPNDPQPPTNWVRATKFGTERHLLTEAQMPAHFHSGVTEGGNSRYYRTTNGVGLNTDQNHVVGFLNGNFVDRTDANYPLSNHTHNFTTNSKGENEPHNNLQPSLVLNYIIKL